MMIKSNIIMGLKSLYSAKQRSILALLGIVIGIGSVIAMVSVGIIVKEHSLKEFIALGTDYIVVQEAWGSSSSESAPTMTADMVEDMPLFLSSIVTASPIGQGSGQFAYQGKSYNPQVVGAEQDFVSINRFKVAQGRFVSNLDKKGKFVVLGAQVAKDMKANGAIKLIGEQIKLQDKLYTIIGIMESAPSSGLKPFSIDAAIVIPLSTYLYDFDQAKVSAALARMNQAFDPPAVTSDIKSYFALRNKDLAVEVSNAQELINQMKKQMQMFTLLLGAIGSISLIVGGVGVMNVMLVSVSERKKEIGIRRALGAFRRDIQFQFLVESLVLCLLGGLIGLGLGVGASYMIAHKNGWEFVVSESAMILGVGVSTVVGIFFGYYPARQAAYLDPIVALRS